MIVYTSGEWHVKAGREEQFRRVWTGFGGMSGQQGEEGPVAVLLRDKDDPLHFRSFGRWQSEQAAADWQNSAAFREWISELRESLDRMETFNLEVAEVVGQPDHVFAGAGQAAR
jgi:heme-degrading monooxygenase HmoA